MQLRRNSSIGEWLSLVEHLVRDQGVAGSNPVSPTQKAAIPLGKPMGRGLLLFRMVRCVPPARQNQ